MKIKKKPKAPSNYIVCSVLSQSQLQVILFVNLEDHMKIKLLLTLKVSMIKTDLSDTKLQRK